jgi:hypothetical protein
VRKDDTPESVALELTSSNGWIPRTWEEAHTMVDVCCDDFYGPLMRWNIIDAILALRKEEEDRWARATARVAEERYRRENPYWDNPQFGTWG